MATAFQSAACYAVVYPELSGTPGVVFLVLFSLFLLVTLIFAVVTTASDPTDPVVYKHKESIEKG